MLIGLLIRRLYCIYKIVLTRSSRASLKTMLHGRLIIPISNYRAPSSKSYTGWGLGTAQNCLHASAHPNVE